MARKQLKKKRCPTCKIYFKPKRSTQKYCNRACAAKRTGGRPTLFTPDTIGKLEKAFAMGCSDLEACLFADVSKSALYVYQDKHPKFVERKQVLKEKPVLMARATLVKGLTETENAKWYLTRKRKKEFGSGDLGLGDKEITITVTDLEDK